MGFGRSSYGHRTVHHHHYGGSSRRYYGGGTYYGGDTYTSNGHSGGSCCCMCMSCLVLLGWFLAVIFLGLVGTVHNYDYHEMDPDDSVLVPTPFPGNAWWSCLKVKLKKQGSGSPPEPVEAWLSTTSPTLGEPTPFHYTLNIYNTEFDYWTRNVYSGSVVNVSWSTEAITTLYVYKDVHEDIEKYVDDDDGWYDDDNGWYDDDDWWVSGQPVTPALGHSLQQSTNSLYHPRRKHEKLSDQIRKTAVERRETRSSLLQDRATAHAATLSDFGNDAREGKEVGGALHDLSYSKDLSKTHTGETGENNRPSRGGWTRVPAPPTGTNEGSRDRAGHRLGKGDRAAPGSEGIQMLDFTPGQSSGLLTKSTSGTTGSLVVDTRQNPQWAGTLSFVFGHGYPVTNQGEAHFSGSVTNYEFSTELRADSETRMESLELGVPARLCRLSSNEQPYFTITTGQGAYSDTGSPVTVELTPNYSVALPVLLSPLLIYLLYRLCQHQAQDISTVPSPAPSTDTALAPVEILAPVTSDTPWQPPPSTNPNLHVEAQPGFMAGTMNQGAPTSTDFMSYGGQQRVGYGGQQPIQPGLTTSGW